ncbi:MAG: zinc ABC transporter solute-binding protein [Verrucomicrobiaceae bacterium]|nr:zinc ABC transporter solute-binding protein [Verrucomicrobiaceae bacterium]
MCLSVALCFSIVVISCSDPGDDRGGDTRLFVVTTTTMITDLVKDVAGDKIRIKGLMGPGVDPHLYEPVPDDAIALRQADLVFYNGLLLEGQMTGILEAKGKKAISLGASVPEDKLKGDDRHPDPHIWGNALLWRGCVPVVVNALSEVDPDNAQSYRKRGADVSKRLEQLHQWAVQRVAEVPERARVLITSHDAFEYFGDAYGLQVIGLQGISTVTEAGISQRVKLVDFIRQNSVKAIFVESSVSPAAIESIAEDAGVKIGGELFSDAMGQPGVIEHSGEDEYDLGTYSGMLKHNVNTTVNALK